MKIGNETVVNSNHEKLLVVIFYNKLQFDLHVTKLRSKAAQKLHALARIPIFMTLEKRKLLMNAFIFSV